MSQQDSRVHEMVLVSVSFIPAGAEAGGEYGGASGFALVRVLGDGKLHSFSDLDAEVHGSTYFYGTEARALRAVIGSEYVSYKSDEPLWRADVAFQPDGFMDYWYQNSGDGINEMMEDAIGDAMKWVAVNRPTGRVQFIALYETWSYQEPSTPDGGGDWEEGFDYAGLVPAREAAAALGTIVL